MKNINFRLIKWNAKKLYKKLMLLQSFSRHIPKVSFTLSVFINKKEKINNSNSTYIKLYFIQTVYSIDSNLLIINLLYIQKSLLSVDILKLKVGNSSLHRIGIEKSKKLKNN